MNTDERCILILIVRCKLKYNQILVVISTFIHVYLQFKPQTNPQGWLPHCRPGGLRWQGIVQMLGRPGECQKNSADELWGKSDKTMFHKFTIQSSIISSSSTIISISSSIIISSSFQIKSSSLKSNLVLMLLSIFSLRFFKKVL